MRALTLENRAHRKRFSTHFLGLLPIILFHLLKSSKERGGLEGTGKTIFGYNQKTFPWARKC